MVDLHIYLSESPDICVLIIFLITWIIFKFCLVTCMMSYLSVLSCVSCPDKSFAIGFSHGEEGAIYGADCNAVPIYDVLAKVKPSRCPSLADKPKVFLIQACQGERTDDRCKIR